MVGGESVPDMIRRLNAGVHVVVGKHQLTAYLHVHICLRQFESIIVTLFFPTSELHLVHVEELEYCIYYAGVLI